MRSRSRSPRSWGRARFVSTRSTPAWSNPKGRIARESWRAISARTPKRKRRWAGSASPRISRRRWSSSRQKSRHGSLVKCFTSLAAFVRSLRDSHLLSGCGTAPAPAEQINVRAYVAERVARRIDAINLRNGIKADLSPLRLDVAHALCQGNAAEVNLPAVIRPWHAGISHVAAIAGQLHKHAEPDRTFRQMLTDLVEKKVRGFCGGLLIREVLRALLGLDTKAPMPAN